MKIYISADIEGVTGICHWDETKLNKPDNNMFRKQMLNEVRAACDGATLAGAKEIWIKDAHREGRNLEPSILPENIRYIRGWSNHPFGMMQEIDDSFDAAIMIGYHAFFRSPFNPLSHTLHEEKISSIMINNTEASEFLVNILTAAYVNVPVVFVSGDYGVCEQVMFCFS
jgi:D-amino peptidase